jgi:hypothetical protein
MLLNHLYRRSIVISYDQDSLVSQRDRESLLDSQKYAEKVSKYRNLGSNDIEENLKTE